MRTHFENNNRIRGQRLAELKSKTADLERRLSDARVSLERELMQFGAGPENGSGLDAELPYWSPDDRDAEDDQGGSQAAGWIADAAAADGGQPDDAIGSGAGDGAGGRTETLVSKGRGSAYRRRFWRGHKPALGAALLAALVAVLIVTLSGGGASWPPSVATVQAQAARACGNPDVKSEPGQVNFACAQATRQILWVFALLTSGNNSDFADAKTGRLGLEPITPAQGGEVAWSLNLHHPYDPTSPVDSLAVAARAINNIIGGATVTGATGNTVVQPGLESSSANCVRYTGSAALVSRKDFPSLCAKPLTSPAGEAALVTDVYQKWVVGASPGAAQDAAVLFANAGDPGNAQVQAILRSLTHARPLA
jgi:hypothetical protein